MKWLDEFGRLILWRAESSITPRQAKRGWSAMATAGTCSGNSPLLAPSNCQEGDGAARTSRGVRARPAGSAHRYRKLVALGATVAADQKVGIEHKHDGVVGIAGTERAQIQMQAMGALAEFDKVTRNAERLGVVGAQNQRRAAAQREIAGRAFDGGGLRQQRQGWRVCRSSAGSRRS